MTNIQAINLLKGLEQSLDDYCELNDEGKAAFRIAITALESFGISEQFASKQDKYEYHYDHTDCIWYRRKHGIDVLPLVLSIEMVGMMLWITFFGMEKDINHLGGVCIMNNLINRQAAIDALAEQIALCDKALNTFGISMKDEYAVKVEKASLVAYKEQLEFIPSAQPERKKGAWINEGRIVRCSKCKIGYATVKGIKSALTYNFCPNCGADMRGEQDE